MAVLRVSLLLDFNVPSIVTSGQSNITKNKNWIDEDKTKVTYRQNKLFHWAKKEEIFQFLKDDEVIQISPNYSRHVPAEYHFYRPLEFYMLD